MNRPSLDSSHVPDGDTQLTDAVAEAPSAGRVWFSQLFALLLLLAGIYAVTRGALQYPATSDEVRQLQSSLRQADLSLTNLPTAGDRAGADWGGSVNAWRNKTAERYGAVRLHLFGCYGLVALFPLSLLFAAAMWWRGQFPHSGARLPLDRVQIGMNVTVVVLLAGLRIFDAATLRVMGTTPPVPDLQAFLKMPTQEQKLQRIATLKTRLEQSLKQIQEKKSTVASRAACARAVSLVVWDRDFVSAISEADKQAFRGTLKELAKKTNAEEEACPVLIRAIGALGDAAEAEALEVEREKTRPLWVDVKKPEGVRCFFNAVAAGREADVRKLLERGVNVNALAPGERRTALHEAVSRRQLAVAELLVQKGARHDIAGENAPQNAEKEYPLHRAVGDVRYVKLLLDKGADPNCLDYRGMTPLHVAAAAGDAESAELLLARKARLNALDFLRRTPLDVAKRDSRAPKPAATALRNVLVQHGALTAADLQGKKSTEASISPNAR